FFSSRRRHTRFSRDWSSDVCSSDLKRQRVRKQRAEACFQRALTVCAGDLCGRLAGGWLSILQTVVTEQQVNSNAAMEAGNLELGTTTALEELDASPKLLSDEFDPGSE